ncbi:MAG: 16S rRNA (guanine(527)-N(7))-methyltransferase RsmG, partial [Oscillospiraceae bacterium]
YNTKVNLTAIIDAEGIENKHFIDSLLLAKQPEIQGKLVDVGTGAGFPGVVVKLANPQIDLTLMEPTGKRVEFLKYLCSELNIKASIIKERAEEAARKVWRESFDVATARAVANMSALCEYCLPLLKVGGVFIAMKSDASQELEDAMPAIEKLGGEYMRTESFVLPNGERRTLIFVKKISQTPSVYPRNGGKIAKAPLK